ncbi:MAG: hypothetical protein C1O27_001290 [Chloroflexi bacterium]|nr:MAG: hypothetical protein C1O27_001290 [Chloroflexota bacterium]
MADVNEDRPLRVAVSSGDTAGGGVGVGTTATVGDGGGGAVVAVDSGVLGRVVVGMGETSSTTSTVGEGWMGMVAIWVGTGGSEALDGVVEVPLQANPTRATMPPRSERVNGLTDDRRSSLRLSSTLRP